jgi:branched-chain amino acid transport system permease protein
MSAVGGKLWSMFGVFAFVALTAAVPLWLSKYHVFQLTMIVIYSIALLGLNILTGYNGQISFGHGVFYAIGAYTAAILLNHDFAPYWTAIPAGAIICLIVGCLFGLPALRLEGPYLGLATFALAVATPQLIKFRSFEPWTGGVQGLVLDAPMPPPAIPLNSDQWLFYQCFFVAILMFVLGRNIVRSRTGLALMAIRDNPVAAATMGINTALYKTLAFGVSAMYAGIAGGLSALVTQFVAPDSFTIFFSISLLVGCVVGGVASISGAIFGAAFIELVPNVADELSKAAPWTIYGVFLLAFMFLAPRGIASLIHMGWSKAFQRKL